MNALIQAEKTTINSDIHFFFFLHIFLCLEMKKKMSTWHFPLSIPSQTWAQPSCITDIALNTNIPDALPLRGNRMKKKAFWPDGVTFIFIIRQNELYSCKSQMHASSLNNAKWMWLQTPPTRGKLLLSHVYLHLVDDWPLLHTHCIFNHICCENHRKELTNFHNISKSL